MGQLAALPLPLQPAMSSVPQPVSLTCLQKQGMLGVQNELYCTVDGEGKIQIQLLL